MAKPREIEKPQATGSFGRDSARWPFVCGWCGRERIPGKRWLFCSWECRARRREWDSDLTKLNGPRQKGGAT